MSRCSVSSVAPAPGEGWCRFPRKFGISQDGAVVTISRSYSYGRDDGCSASTHSDVLAESARARRGCFSGERSKLARVSCRMPFQTRAEGRELSITRDVNQCCCAALRSAGAEQAKTRLGNPRAAVGRFHLRLGLVFDLRDTLKPASSAAFSARRLRGCAPQSPWLRLRWERGKRSGCAFPLAANRFGFWHRSAF
jgi:hypothetical protein